MVMSAYAEGNGGVVAHLHTAGFHKKAVTGVSKRRVSSQDDRRLRERRGWRRHISSRNHWPSFEYYLAQKKILDAEIARKKIDKGKARASVLITNLNPVRNAIMADKVLDQRAEAAPSVASQHFFGTWGGIQPWLVNHGIQLLLSVNEEFAGNITGGRRRTSTITGQVGLQLDIDWDKLAGVKNFKTHTIIVNGHGQSVSSAFGDNIAAVQEIYGARGNVIAHLVAMYAEETLFKGRLDINAGWMPVGSFFAASPLFCAYMNVAICGNPSPNKYTNAAKDWPSGNLGTVVRVMPTSNTYIMGGLFAVSPHAYTGGISGWSWAQSGLGKFSSPVEIGWIPQFGKNHLIGHYKLGYAYDNSRVPNFYKDIYGHSWQATGQPRKYQAGQNSAWLMVDQMLKRNGPGDTNGLILLAGAMYSDGKTVAMRDHTWVGLMDAGSDWGRPLDTVGIMWQHFDMSSTVARQQEASLALGLPYQSNQWGGVYGIQSHENVYELFYSVHVARAMAIQPDFQYIQRPSATTTFHDAAVLGVQFSVVL
ncbi:carbohydrate porin [Saccharibacter sp. 17.LH.SD]|uniref:carbohydrate porin n=1 Tax=Saccharibacter sp. 17.LH.SD TaxID=2689393 RepID=UPI001F2CE0E1|nr:carbohydrate porin [Saccharibacter sp. 17.LH.SD]